MLLVKDKETGELHLLANYYTNYPILIDKYKIIKSVKVCKGLRNKRTSKLNDLIKMHENFIKEFQRKIKDKKVLVKRLKELKE